MANQWFKFYAGDYLADPKMLSLSAVRRSCWLTLLCYACMADDDGRVKYVTEEKLMTQAGVVPGTKEWSETRGVFDYFQALGMIEVGGIIRDEVTILNWEKRQESYLSNAERQAKFREKQKSNADVTPMSQNSNARIEKNRIDKSNTDTGLPEWLDKEAWDSWTRYRIDIRKKLTPQSIKLQLRALEQDIPNHRAMIENSIKNGWTGLFAVKSENKRSDAPKEPSKYKNVKTIEA